MIATASPGPLSPHGCSGGGGDNGYRYRYVEPQPRNGPVDDEHRTGFRVSRFWVTFRSDRGENVVVNRVGGGPFVSLSDADNNMCVHVCVCVLAKSPGKARGESLLKTDSFSLGGGP